MPRKECCVKRVVDDKQQVTLQMTEGNLEMTQDQLLMYWTLLSEPKTQCQKEMHFIDYSMQAQHHLISFIQSESSLRARKQKLIGFPCETSLQHHAQHIPDKSDLQTVVRKAPQTSNSDNGSLRSSVWLPNET